jgi:TRAP-type C4-dicarboxylate transport system permease small subunit
MNRLFSAIERLNLLLGTVAGFLVLGLIAAVAPDVASRALLGRPIYGSSETASLVLVLIVFLGLAAAQVRKEHFRIVVLEEALTPGLRRALAVPRLVVCILGGSALTWFSMQGAWHSTMTLESTFAVIQFPIWPSKIVICLGFLLLTLQYIIDLYRLLVLGYEAPSNDLHRGIE